MTSTSRIAITLGDPAGIGAEITLRALATLPTTLRQRILLYGHAPLLNAQRHHLRAVCNDLPHLPIHTLRHAHDPLPDGDHIALVDVLPDTSITELTWGQPSRVGAQLQYAALTRAIDDALNHRIDAIVTAPWTKHILSLADLPPTGHTEVLGQRTGTSRPVMMLAGDALRVALVTTHIPLRHVADALTHDHITHVIHTVAEAGQRDYGMTQPRIAVCGLNPHAGEAGVLGHEDQAIIAPAIAQAQRELGDRAVVKGPYPADGLFARVLRRDVADFVIAMYHDQGLGPLKRWHAGEAANITLGLPFVRTSVDHGAAYDIAGQGIADPASLHYAITLAATFVRQRQNSTP